MISSDITDTRLGHQTSSFIRSFKLIGLTEDELEKYWSTIILATRSVGWTWSHHTLFPLSGHKLDWAVHRPIPLCTHLCHPQSLKKVIFNEHWLLNLEQESTIQEETLPNAWGFVYKSMKIGNIPDIVYIGAKNRVLSRSIAGLSRALKSCAASCRSAAHSPFVDLDALAIGIHPKGPDNRTRTLRAPSS